MEGILLYNSLTPVTRVGLVLDDLEVPLALQWLRVNGLNAHGELVEGDPRWQGTELREWQVERARARGPVDLLIDSDPSNAAMALKQGLTSLLFSQPQYARPEFRPDLRPEIKPWAEISSEVSRQRDLLTRDERVKADVLHRPE
jgi:hypothetical protein